MAKHNSHPVPADQEIFDSSSASEIIDTDTADVPETDQPEAHDEDPDNAPEPETDLVELTNGVESVLAHPTQVAHWKKQGWVEAE